jgi:hypothetical protein
MADDLDLETDVESVPRPRPWACQRPPPLAAGGTAASRVQQGSGIGFIGSDGNRPEWRPFSPALTGHNMPRHYRAAGSHDQAGRI